LLHARKGRVDTPLLRSLESMDLPAYFGKYLLVHQLGRGGMAELFLAKQSGLKGFEKVLAIKKILPHLTQDPEFVSMFVNEGKLAALLTHQHIVQIFDLGHVDGVYYMAMEYVMGKDVRTLTAKNRERQGRLPVDYALLIVSQVASGLDYAHRKKDLNGRDLNIVHRDVSPQNILVSYEGEVKLVDFGIAKAAGSGQETQTGILKGKLAYMSPEQACGRAIDRRSDVFSLGIVLYELLTGRRLFKGDSDLSTLEQVRTANVEPPTRFIQEIPPALETVVLKALARDPEQRFQTAAEFQSALEKIMAERGQGFSSLHLSQYMAAVFAEELRVDSERFQSAHRETVRLVSVPERPAAASSGPRRDTPRPRATSSPQIAVRPQPVQTSRRMGVVGLGAVLLFVLGALLVIFIPELLGWMRIQSIEIRTIGSHVEGQLRAVGLERLVPQANAKSEIQAVESTTETTATAVASIEAKAEPSTTPSSPGPVDSTIAPSAINPPPSTVAPAPAESGSPLPPPATDVRRLLQHAKAMYAEGRLDAVEETLRSVIEREPNSPMAYHLLGRVYLERKDEERALKILSEASHQFPRNPVLHYDLGFLYAQRGLGSLAKEELSHALTIQPDGPSAAQARLYLRSGIVSKPGGPPPPEPESVSPAVEPPVDTPEKSVETPPTQALGAESTTTTETP